MPTKRNKGTITIPKDKLPSKSKPVAKRKTMVIPKKKIESAIRPKAVAKPKPKPKAKPKMKLNIISKDDPANKTMAKIKSKAVAKPKSIDYIFSVMPPMVDETIFERVEENHVDPNSRQAIAERDREARKMFNRLLSNMANSKPPVKAKNKEEFKKIWKFTWRNTV